MFVPDKNGPSDDTAKITSAQKSYILIMPNILGPSTPLLIFKFFFERKIIERDIKH